ncbi:unnamed protein product [Prorocentrum cordatum]|uniref:Uncharacterized protein n=1 Tax=Prorocentrum cordatum TaxID=2364126 RepID=A0ABN9UXH7_9DINO|nr:unnamed protein product [Polarella glacialis]
MKTGIHVLINIPRGISAENAFLRVQAEARRFGGSCADMYFQALNVTGLWAEAKQAGGYHFDSHSGVNENSGWFALGSVEVKVAHGRTQGGAASPWGACWERTTIRTQPRSQLNVRSYWP